jgi:Xaa-Pro aminopeptidase
MPAPTTATSGPERTPTSLDSHSVFDYAERQRRLAERMEAEDVDVLFLAPSADLEYLTGVERQIPNFGEASYPSGWITGAFLVPGSDPVFLFPRMFAAFDLREEPQGEVVVVGETDDGFAAFERVAQGLGSKGTIAVGDRVWAETVLSLGRVLGFDRLRTGSTLVNELRRVKTQEELQAMGRAIRTVERAMEAVTPLVVPGTTMAELAEAVEHELRAAGSRTPSFATHIFTGLGEIDLDSSTSTAQEPMREGTSVMFDFGGVVDGYCSDFGRTIYCGDPPPEYRDVYEVMLAAQEAGRAAAAAGTPASEVNEGCRRPIEEAGLGEHFRHRMGHGIGMDVHERPFISTEDETPLEPGMTFTDEPSIIIPGRFSVRIEDILVCEEGGGRKLNSYPTALVAT